MNRAEMLVRLQAVFSEVLGRPVVLTEDLDADALDGWDSLTHIALVAAIEDEFQVRFPMREIPELRAVSAIVNRLLQRSVELGG